MDGCNSRSEPRSTGAPLYRSPAPLRSRLVHTRGSFAHAARSHTRLVVSAPNARSLAKGFTLVEVVIVVIILGLLAVLVVPHLSTAANAEREASLRDDLHFLRTQIMVYQAQHNDVAPGYPKGDFTAEPSQTVFIDQMTMYTDKAGNTSRTPSDIFKYGPYLQRLPKNTLNHNSNIQFVGSDNFFPVQTSGLDGWLYQPSAGTIAANAQGSDLHGVRYIDY